MSTRRQGGQAGHARRWRRRPLHNRLRALLLTLWPGLLAAPASAAAEDLPERPAVQALPRVLVTSAQVSTIDDFQMPASVRSIDLSGEGARPEVELSEVLAGVPGLLARDRQNYAQDTQLSIRGFGARATFGVRGLRLYADGIPASLPDGQGQVSHFSLAGAERVEVLRGPFSALHGNASGGVIQLWTADGTPGGDGSLRVSHGRDASTALSLRLSDASEQAGYRLALTRFDTDGYREHSAARRELGNARLHFDLAAQTRLALTINHLDAPDTLDPLGLNEAQLAQDRRQATPVALAFNTRKSVRQDQLGLRLDHQLDERQQLQLMSWGGRREVEQFLSVPVAAQRNPLSAGGVIDLNNRYSGADLRWNWRGELAGGAAELSLGLASEGLRQQRLGFENFVDDQLGLRGALRRDERNRISSDARYAQLWWQFGARWSLLAGLRDSRVRFDSRDRYITADNPDDSGRISYAERTPVLGLAWDASADLRLHLSAGRGFETPTFNELSYRLDGGAGLAFDLRPALSDSVELGAKWRRDDHWAELALFRADTEDELAVARNVGGRSSFRNAGRARRQGAELAFGSQWGEAWQAEVALTLLDARFRDAFPICSGAGCSTPNQQVAAGARIPGVARQQLWARLQWQKADWTLAAEASAVGRVSVNDLGSASAPGFALLHLEAAREWSFASGQLRGFARLDNALDQDYVGSVIVNEGNGRFYEPGPGRGLLLGMQWLW